MRRVPSLRGLQAFEAVARTGNLAAAAESIGITPSVLIGKFVVLSHR
jgi:LysR family glycine cleavage system transcriptional activator